MYSRIVVPLDGSDVAEFALPAALEMARRFGAPLHLVRVVDPPPTSFAFGVDSMIAARSMAVQRQTERTLATEYLKENASELARDGIEVTTEILNGAAPSELVRTMRKGDLLVMSSHGRSGIARWYLGSVAEQVVRQATVPVLVVRGETAHSVNQRTAARTLAMAK
jgi:nucleotide-binding universal stress UspA family protein